jgi:RNA recognition motif-containing protein
MHVRVQDGKGRRVAFVEFDSIEASSAALQQLNGFQNMHVDYARNPLGKRKNQ